MKTRHAHRALLLSGFIPLLSACFAWSAGPKVGNDRDAHGCLPSGGYRWCERTQTCEREWELSEEEGVYFDDFELYCLSVPPEFDQYPVKPGEQLLEFVDLSTIPEFEIYHDRFESAVGRAPDFAGHYVSVSFGCGTACQSILFVDTLTGQVIHGETASAGFCYQPDSSMIIINPYIADYYEGEPPAWASTQYYKLEDDQLILLERTKSPYAGECVHGH